jgi:hypothetical protein
LYNVNILSYAHRRNLSPPASHKNSPQGTKSHAVLPSHKKYEDNKEEIKYLEKLLMELNKDRNLVY